MENTLKRLQPLFRIISILVLITTGYFLWENTLHKQTDAVKEFLLTSKTEQGIWILFVGSIVYLLLLSLPFIPGVELGFMLLCIFGQQGILPIYLATVCGLRFPLLWVNIFLTIGYRNY